jgi:hypothetical protein
VICRSDWKDSSTGSEVAGGDMERIVLEVGESARRPTIGRPGQTGRAKVIKRSVRRSGGRAVVKGWAL